MSAAAAAANRRVAAIMPRRGDGGNRRPDARYGLAAGVAAEAAGGAFGTSAPGPEGCGLK